MKTSLGLFRLDYVYVTRSYVLQYVDEQNGYLCGYLKIKGLTEEFPNLTTYFDGEIINKKCPFLTRKWDADEEVDKKHWVSIACMLCYIISSYIFHITYFVILLY